MLPNTQGVRAISKEQFTQKEDGLLEPALVMGKGEGKDAMKGRNRERRSWELVLPFEQCKSGSVAGNLEVLGWRITRP